MRPTHLCIAALLSTFGWGAGTAQAADFYVAPSGSDSASGRIGTPLKTVGAAIVRASNGDTVRVASGNYPAIRDVTQRSGSVTVQGTPGTEIAGANLLGASGLRFVGVRFARPVLIAHHPMLRERQKSHDLSFVNDEFTTRSAGTAATGLDYCMMIRTGSSDISVVNSLVHECSYGILGPPLDAPSRGITLARNVMRDLGGDAIQFGAWTNVRISDNEIRDLHDPAKITHNDGIQIIGNAKGVSITGNRILNSDGQLVLVQDALGPNDDVAVTDNTMSGSGAFAVQSQGTTKLQVINNTIWGARYGALLIRKGIKVGAPLPNDCVVANNIVQSLSYTDQVKCGFQDYNVIAKGSVAGNGPHDVMVADPEFAAPDRNDFSLRTSSRAKGIASIDKARAAGTIDADSTVADAGAVTSTSPRLAKPRRR